MQIQSYRLLLAEAKGTMNCTMVCDARNRTCSCWQSLNTLSDVAVKLQPYIKSTSLIRSLEKVREGKARGQGPPDTAQELIEAVEEAFILYRELYVPFFSGETILIQHVRAILDSHAECSVQEEFRFVIEDSIEQHVEAWLLSNYFVLFLHRLCRSSIVWRLC